VAAPDTAVSTSSLCVAHQRVVFIAGVVRESTVCGPALQQADGTVLQIRQGTAVDDCEKKFDKLPRSRTREIAGMAFRENEMLAELQADPEMELLV